jgi:[1-hydroxy-2-(trimethylamino)ethyl]phosphonate dioxygenase
MNVFERITAVFNECGNRHYGENVSELEHALQAAEFARQAGESDAVVLSCLLHDFGHMLHENGEDIALRGIDARHEQLGAELLKDYFDQEILEPIRQHVAAKRYLCRVDPEYLQSLSESSLLSLKLQGGPMTDVELREFESNPWFDSCIRVRRYDDLGKVPGMITASLSSYRELIERLQKT